MTCLDQIRPAPDRCKDQCEYGGRTHRRTRRRPFILRHELSTNITIGIGEGRVATAIHNILLPWPRTNATMNRTQMAAKRLMQAIQYHTFDCSPWQ